MRQFIIAGLMAATLVPAAAMAQPAPQMRRERPQMHEQHRGPAYDTRRDARRDQRDDWRDYRRAHRDVFRQPAYAGPRGWVYRPVTPGYRLDRRYYASRYYVVDPYRYRLPAVRGSLRWVRYGNDVLLVDTRSGRVREAYRDFFWW